MGGLLALQSQSTWTSRNTLRRRGCSWQALIGWLRDSPELETDQERPCLEEHIQSGESVGQENEFHLILLQPVARK